MKHGVDLSAPCFFDVYIYVGILYNIFEILCKNQLLRYEVL